MATHCVTDEAQFQHILSSERPRLVRLCAYLTGEPDTAEDLAQEVLIEAWRHIENLRDPQAFNAWLNGIARNVSARWLRARGRDIAALGRPLDDTTQQPVDDADLEVALERHELATLLDRALALLPEATRAVLIEKYISESPHEAIAEQLQMSENAVAVRLHRGKLALYKLLTTELRDEAATLGLIKGDEWQETRIWCSSCGEHRLLGTFTETDFALRCPGCSVEPGSFHSQSSSTTILQGVKAFRPALTRFSTWMDGFFQRALVSGFAHCQRCGHPTPLHLHLPDYAPPLVRQRRGLHVKCTRCGAGSYETLDGLALNLPQGRHFWKAHPRIRTLPQQEIEIAGVPALLVAFESVDRRATLDVILRGDSYAVLEVRGGADV